MNQWEDNSAVLTAVQSWRSRRLFPFKKSNSSYTLFKLIHSKVLKTETTFHQGCSSRSLILGGLIMSVPESLGKTGEAD